MARKKYYAVARGRKPGIYTQWFGGDGAEAQVRGFPGARFKGFPTRQAAEAFLKAAGGDSDDGRPVPAAAGAPRSAGIPTLAGETAGPAGRVVIYTDGGCIRNPGPGGWGVVLIKGKKKREFSGGFRMTTNNRMELTACIAGLQAIAPGTRVTLYTDSRYVVNGITRGWARRWRANGWMRTRTEKALNADLWQQLLDLCETRRVDFRWVKGHAGIPENERCDQLAGQAALKRNLPPDPGYEMS